MTTHPTKEVLVVGGDPATKYEISPEKVAELAKKYDAITVVPADKQSYHVGKRACMDLVHTINAVDRRRKELGEDARKWVSEVNQAAKELTAPLIPIKERLKSELSAEDARLQAIIDAAALAEAERIKGIKDRIAAIRAFPLDLVGKTARQIEQIRLEFIGQCVTQEFYAECYEEALNATAATAAMLQTALDNQRAVEEADARRKAEEARLEAIRLEQAAEALRLEEVRKAQEDEQRRMREEHESKVREEYRSFPYSGGHDDFLSLSHFFRKDREEFERKAIEDARIKAEQDARERAERAERERVEREDAERIERERREALRPDKEKLLAWADRLSAMPTPSDLATTDGKDLVIELDGKLTDLILEIRDSANTL